MSTDQFTSWWLTPVSSTKKNFYQESSQRRTEHKVETNFKRRFSYYQPKKHQGPKGFIERKII